MLARQVYDEPRQEGADLSVEYALLSCALSTDGTPESPVEILDLDFFDDEQLILIFRLPSQGGESHYVYGHQRAASQTKLPIFSDGIHRHGWLQRFRVYKNGQSYRDPTTNYTGGACRLASRTGKLLEAATLPKGT